jgi:Ca2+-binding RTX toxin-like protein
MDDPTWLSCDSRAKAVEGDLGDGDDGLTVSTYETSPIEVDANGGPGDDRLELWYASDARMPGHLVGGDGNDVLIGNSVHDELLGGPGDDLLQGDSEEGSAPDRLDGGPGRDRIIYGEYERLEVSVTLPSGPFPDGDSVTAVEGVEGTREGDRLIGDRRRNTLIGGAGADRLRGGGGRDVLVGGADADRIDSRDASADVVACGSGSDSVVADRRDEISAQCERVRLG